MTHCVTTPNILWRIKNFTSLNKKTSPTIRFMGMKFYMSISKYVESGAARLQLNMGCANTSQALSSGSFKIEVCISRNNNRYMLKGGTYDLAENEWCIWADFVSNICKTFDTDDVTFLIMITLTERYQTILKREESVEETKELTTCMMSLSEEIGNLFNNAECSDFSLKCGSKSFFVHKAILSARSHFFAGMFRCDMREANEDDGKIEKIEPEILELVLRYLYTGELPQLSMNSVQKVYAAADRLIVEPLKIKCLSLFIDSFTNESEDDDENATKSEESVVEKFESCEKDSNDIKEREMLKNLFMSREWRLFSEEFPHKAHEMCKPYLLKQL